MATIDDYLFRSSLHSTALAVGSARHSYVTACADCRSRNLATDKTSRIGYQTAY